MKKDTDEALASQAAERQAAEQTAAAEEKAASSEKKAESSAEQPAAETGPASQLQEQLAQQEKELAQQKEEQASQLQEQLAQREKELAQAKDSLLRTQAELQNVQRIAQRDVANARNYGSKELVSAVLPCVDSLEQALAQKQTSTEALRQGVQMTLDNLEKALTVVAVKPFSPLGEAFDPSLHLASAIKPDSESASGRQEVLEVLQRGWMIGDRVLRSATVVISAPADQSMSAPADRATENNDKKEDEK